MVIMPTKHEGEVEVAGKAINLAARLKRVCRPGSIVIDRATWDRIGRAFHVAALGPESFEGIEGKVVEAFELGLPRSGLTTFAARNAAPSRPLVGRDAETAELRKQWLLACEGHGQSEPGSRFKSTISALEPQVDIARAGDYRKRWCRPCPRCFIASIASSRKIRAKRRGLQRRSIGVQKESLATRATEAGVQGPGNAR